jgi:putative transposase
MKAHHELPLFSGSIYHVYNRTNNGEKLFLDDEHRQFFLSRYQRYMSPLVDTYAYCLLSNHFHFLIKVKPMKDLLQVSKDTEKMMKGGLVSEYFRRFFISYTKAFNKSCGRYGNLFQRPFKRKLITDSDYFRRAVYYINYNPQKHGLEKNFMDYEWSSYYDLVNGKSVLLDTKTVMEFFGGELFF